MSTQLPVRFEPSVTPGHVRVIVRVGGRKVLLTVSLDEAHQMAQDLDLAITGARHT